MAVVEIKQWKDLGQMQVSRSGKYPRCSYHKQPFFLQEIFPTQELNPGLLLCRQILY